MTLTEDVVETECSPVASTSVITFWKVALLAFIAMCVQDILATCMVIFEARLNAPVAGLFDVASWITGLICLALSVESIIASGWRSKRTLTIIVAVSAANFLGTVAGVTIGAALTHH